MQTITKKTEISNHSNINQYAHKAMQISVVVKEVIIYPNDLNSIQYTMCNVNIDADRNTSNHLRE